MSRINERAQDVNATIAQTLNPATVVRTRAALRTLIDSTPVSS
ncbi:MAG: hypothetical protein ACXWZR_03510 [Mycobacterium sp.]